MIVYILIGEVDYETREVLAVYSDKQIADSDREQITIRPYNRLIVEEHEVLQSSIFKP
jgi:hypothetical protein